MCFRSDDDSMVEIITIDSDSSCNLQLDEETIIITTSQSSRESVEVPESMPGPSTSRGSGDEPYANKYFSLLLIFKNNPFFVVTCRMNGQEITVLQTFLQLKKYYFANIQKVE